jgi:hypothetical protein
LSSCIHSLLFVCKGSLIMRVWLMLLPQSAVDEMPADASSEDETMEAVAQAGAAMGR